MAWVKIDDHFDEHPKLAKVGPLGWGIWLAGLSYCNRNLTDGFIPRSKAHILASFDIVDEDSGQLWNLSRTSGMSGDEIDAPWVIAMLVNAAIWDEVPGGYQIHDYSDYQPTKAQILEERERKAAAGKAGGQASAEARAQAAAKGRRKPRAQAKSNPVPVPVPVPVSVPSVSNETEKGVNPPNPPETVKSQTIHEQRFDQFWTAYPKRVGKDAARRWWLKAKPDAALLATMLKAIEGQKLSPQWCKDGGQFVPNPATWLSQGRWNDEPHVDVPASGARASPAPSEIPRDEFPADGGLAEWREMQRRSGDRRGTREATP